MHLPRSLHSNRMQARHPIQGKFRAGDEGYCIAGDLSIKSGLNCGLPATIDRPFSQASIYGYAD